MVVWEIRDLGQRVKAFGEDIYPLHCIAFRKQK